jgi:hypothetical protein
MGEALVIALAVRSIFALTGEALGEDLETSEEAVPLARLAFLLDCRPLIKLFSGSTCYPPNLF